MSPSGCIRFMSRQRRWAEWRHLLVRSGALRLIMRRASAGTTSVPFDPRRDLLVRSAFGRDALVASGSHRLIIYLASAGTTSVPLRLALFGGTCLSGACHKFGLSNVLSAARQCPGSAPPQPSPHAGREIGSDLPEETKHRALPTRGEGDSFPPACGGM